MKTVLSLLVAFAFAVPAVAQDEEAKPDHEAVQGEWRLDEIWTNGEKVEEDMDIVLKFSGDTVTHVQGDMEQDGKFEMNSEEEPKQIDIIIEMDGQEFTMQMIYELDGDTMKLCGAEGPGADRPTEFSDEDGQSIAVLKRVTD